MRLLAIGVMVIVLLLPRWLAAEETPVGVGSGEPASSATSSTKAVEKEDLIKRLGEYYQAGEFDKGVELCASIINRDPSNVAALLGRALFFQQQKKYDGAIEDYKKGISLSPGNEVANGMLGGLLIETGKPEEAQQYCRKAYELKPDNLTWTVNAGHTYHLNGDTEKASEYYKKALALINSEAELTNGPVAWFKLFIQKGWHVEASMKWIDWFQQGFADLQEARKLSPDAEKQIKAGNIDAATSLIKKIIAIVEKIYGPDNAYTAKIIYIIARLHFDAGQYSEAEPLYKRSLAIREKVLGAEHADTAINLHNLAWLYKTTGRYSEAEPLFKRSLVIMEKTLGPEHPDTTMNINNLAGLYQTTGRYAEAEPLYKRSLAIREKALGPEHSDTAASLNNLAWLYQTTGRYAEAEPLYKRSLVIYEKALGPEHPDTAMNINNLAALYQKTGRYAEAEPLYKRSLAIREKTLGPEHSDTAASLMNLAWLYQTTGRYVEAEPLYKRSLAIMEKSLGPEHPNTAMNITDLAILYETTGRYAEAESLHKRSLTIREQALGPEHDDTAASLINLAGLYHTTGRYVEAEPLYKRSLAIIEKSLGPEHPNTAINISNLAKLYLTTGRYAEAEPLYKLSLAIREKSLGPEHADTAASLNDLASLYKSTGRYAKAEPLYKCALSITERTLGAEHANTAQILWSLAELYLKMDRYNDVDPLIERTLAISKKAFGDEHIFVAASYYLQGDLYLKTGRFNEVESLFRKALVIFEKAIGKDHPQAPWILKGLVELYIATERYPEAEPLCRRALTIATRGGSPEVLWEVQNACSHLMAKQDNVVAAIFFAKQAVNTIQGMRQNVSGLGNETLKSFTGTVEDAYKNLGDLLIGQGRLAEAQEVLTMLKEEEYFQYIRRASSESAKLTTRATYTASEEPWYREYDKKTAENAKLGKELGSLRFKAAKGVLTEAEQTRLNQLLADEQKANEDFNTFITRLVTAMKEEARRLSEEDRDKRLVELGEMNLKGSGAISQTLRDLGEGSVLIQYLVTNDRVHIVLTSPDFQLARHSDIKASVLNDKIFALRELLTNPRLDPRPAAKELYDLLVLPVAADLQKYQAQILMLYLDGALRYLPFAALYDGTDYLVKTYRTVMYTEVAKDKIALAPKSAWRVAALGVSEKVNQEFSALRFVPMELNGIVRQGETGVIPGEIHLNREFTEQTLLQSAVRNPVIHISSHFRFSPGTDLDSYLLLGDGSTLTLDKVRNSSYFRGCELLTLSACATAMGTNAKGKEIEGLAAIAMERGAKAVIATLWSVVDESTALLMQEFYRLREERKLIKVESLRQAQLSLMNGAFRRPDAAADTDRSGTDRPKRQKAQIYYAESGKPYSHPYFWAPFILMGNWK